LVSALVREGFLPTETDIEATADGPLTQALILAAHRYLAASPARLMMVQPEDWLGVVDQINLPGTVDEHPNWRRKLPMTIDELGTDSMGEQLASVLGQARGGPAGPAAGRASNES